MENQSEDREEKKGRQDVEEREYVIRLRLPKIHHLVNNETLGHLRAARKETLLAVRGIIDAAIEGLDAKSKPGSKGPTKIDIE